MRQLARALTGFRNDWTDAGPTRFRFDKKFHDREAEAHLRQPRQVRLAGGRAAGHPPPPPPRVHGHEALGLLHPDQAVGRDDEGAGAAVRRQGPRRPPVAGGDPRAPRPLRPGKRMVKPPVVQAAGMLRAVGRGIDTPAWAWLCDSAGQYLFMPPNVSGWDDTPLARHGDVPRALADGAVHLQPGEARSARRRHRAVRSRPSWSTRAALLGLAEALRAGACRPRALRRRHARDRRRELEGGELPVLAENALRMLIATSPDYLTS